MTQRLKLAKVKNTGNLYIKTILPTSKWRAADRHRFESLKQLVQKSYHIFYAFLPIRVLVEYFFEYESFSKQIKLFHSEVSDIQDIPSIIAAKQSICNKYSREHSTFMVFINIVSSKKNSLAN